MSSSQRQAADFYEEPPTYVSHEKIYPTLNHEKYVDGSQFNK